MVIRLVRREAGALCIQALVNRIKADQRFLDAHPDQAEMLRGNIQRNCRYLIQLCLLNDGEHIFEQNLDSRHLDTVNMKGLEFLQSSIDSVNIKGE